MTHEQKAYPRPQFIRKDWQNLNGTWDFSFDEENRGLVEKWYLQFPEEHRSIQVPFVYESAMSGIGETKACDQVWYRRKLEMDGEELKGRRCLLHFEGSDYQTDVWVNGSHAGSHRGGYARFTMDITELLRPGENMLTVRVSDSYSTQQPRGKQRWIPNNFGCWYVQSTGIWKTVWMELVPERYIEKVKMTPNLQMRTLQIVAVLGGRPLSEEKLSLRADVSFQGKFISGCAVSVTGETVQMTLNVNAEVPEPGMEWGIRTWSPEHPDLYDIKFRLTDEKSEQQTVLDEVDSYFAMRDIRIEGKDILLNGQPLYQRLILDQGYWKDSLLTPPDAEALLTDIDRIQSMGYNGVRKHQKVEDERFLYWCDVKGLLVWCEMPSTYAFTDSAVEAFAREWTEIVAQNYNHPSIITWTPFNESWGIPEVKTDVCQQQFTQAIYHLTKSIDSMRPVITNDGWEHTVSDILTLHDYTEDGSELYARYTARWQEILNNELCPQGAKKAFAEGFGHRGQPVIISEYGGIAFSGQEGWGYGNMVQDEETFLKRFDAVTSAIKRLPECCGYCYTQVTDVQQEVNGLMDMERKVKVDPEKIREINLRREHG